MTTDRPVGAEPSEVERDQLPDAGLTTRISETTWIIGAAGIFLVAAALRLWALPQAPFHNDEGVSGWFVIQLLRNGEWTYDPGVYFGPTPYYTGLLSVIVLGLNDVAMRIVPATFGLATIALLLALRGYIGYVGSLVAAAMLAVSTGWLYYSRAFFAEELLIFYTVALVYCAWRWTETRRTQFLVFGAVVAALLFATKGTSYIAVAVLGISVVCVEVYERLRIPERLRSLGRTAVDGGAPPAGGDVARGKPVGKRSKSSRRGKQKRAASLDDRPFASLGRGELVISLPVVGAGLVFAVIYITLFSSFFSNPKGVADSFTTLAAWSGTAATTHAKPITQYAEWLIRAEAPILVLAVLGGLAAVLGGRSRFALFASLWAAGLFAAYSIIAYKEPWLTLNFVVPMAIVGGYGVDRLWQMWPARRVIVVAAAGALFAFSGYGAIRLSFYDYDIDSNPYVYVQTSRDIFNLTDAVAAAGTELGTGDETPIVIMSPDYWPLPWYWRDHPNAGFYGAVVETTNPIAIVRVDQESTLPATFTAVYERRGEYTLRPGVQLVLYVRQATSGL